MRLDTLRDYPMTAEIYRATKVEDGTPIYTYLGTVPCDLSTNNGLLFTFSTPVVLEVMDRIVYIVDSNGVLVIDDQYDVKKRIPLINEFGASEGMIYTVSTATTGLTDIRNSE